jgi:hypothetical protein
MNSGTNISFRHRATDSVEATEDLTQRDFETLFGEDDNDDDEPKFTDFNSSELLNSSLFNLSDNSSNGISFGIEMEDMEPTPMAPNSISSHQQQQDNHQQMLIDQMEAQFKFADLKPTNQLFEPTPIRTKVDIQSEKRMIIDNQGFPVNKEKVKKASSKKSRARLKPVPIAPAGPIPIAPMPATGIPPDSQIPIRQQQLNHAPLSLMPSPLMLDARGNPLYSLPSMHPSMSQSSNNHSFPPAYIPDSQVMPHIPSNDILSYSESMEKLSESMKRSAMSRTLVKQLSSRQSSARSLSTDTGSLDSASNATPPLRKTRKPSRQSLARSLSNDTGSLDSGSNATPPHRKTRKPTAGSKHRGGARSKKRSGLPLGLVSGEEGAPRDNRTVYSAASADYSLAASYSTDNGTVNSGQTI